MMALDNTERRFMIDTCMTCRFWKRGESFEVQNEEITPKSGICRYWPPVIVTAGEWAGDSAFPDTNESDWCGCYCEEYDVDNMF